MSDPLIACIEAGGTKFVTGIASGPGDIRERQRFDTVTPEETIGAVSRWLAGVCGKYPIAGLGIASFGPIELDRSAANWGFITGTTKPGWSNSDFAARLMRESGLATGCDTDVNGAALAEARWGAGRDQKISVYVTVGTGIGGGAIADGKILHGLTHPEMGHMHLPRHPEDRNFAGICPLHGDCVEGLASGPAIKARWGCSLSELPADHPGHGIIAFYLAQMVLTLQSIMEPGRVILGGGVMATPGLIVAIRAAAAAIGKGYSRGIPEEIIVPPALGDDSGLLGALALAQDALG